MYEHGALKYCWPTKRIDLGALTTPSNYWLYGTEQKGKSEMLFYGETRYCIPYC